jgi:hypothetical protein
MRRDVAVERCGFGLGQQDSQRNRHDLSPRLREQHRLPDVVASAASDHDIAMQASRQTERAGNFKLLSVTRLFARLCHGLSRQKTNKNLFHLLVA